MPVAGDQLVECVIDKVSLSFLRSFFPLFFSPSSSFFLFVSSFSSFFFFFLFFLFLVEFVFL